MEKAIFLSPRRALEKKLSGWDRVYVGSEFCERLLPEQDAIRNAIDNTGDAVAMTLVTPYVTDGGLRRVMDLVERFVAVEPVFDEIVINDWGVMRETRGVGCQRVLGRLLVRQLRDPRIIGWKKKTPDKLVRVDELAVNEPFVEFLLSEGIERIELDTIPDDASVLRGRLKVSCYEPFTYITTTRLCPVADIASRDGSVLYVPKTCSYECVGRVYVLKEEVMGTDLYLFGNTIFFRNERTEHAEESSIFDRIVHQELP